MLKSWPFSPGRLIGRYNPSSQNQDSDFINLLRADSLRSLHTQPASDLKSGPDSDRSKSSRAVFARRCWSWKLRSNSNTFELKTSGAVFRESWFPLSIHSQITHSQKFTDDTVVSYTTIYFGHTFAWPCARTFGSGAPTSTLPML